MRSSDSGKQCRRHQFFSPTKRAVFLNMNLRFPNSLQQSDFRQKHQPFCPLGLLGGSYFIIKN
jgi:hypothetical protein